MARARCKDLPSIVTVPPRSRTSWGLEGVKAARRCNLRSQISPPSSRSLRDQSHAAHRLRNAVATLLVHVLAFQAELGAGADIVVQNIEMAVFCQEHLTLQWMRPIVTSLAKSFSLRSSSSFQYHIISVVPRSTIGSSYRVPATGEDTQTRATRRSTGLCQLSLPSFLRMIILRKLRLG